MTTPRIEEMVEEYKNQRGVSHLKHDYPQGYESDISWLRKTLAQARQEGIDEAVEKFRQILVDLHNNKQSELHGGYDDADFLTAYCFSLQEAMQRLEALQDKK